MKLSEIFPRTSAAYPQLAHWRAGFEWPGGCLAVCDLLVRLQHRLMEQSDEHMLAFAISARADLIEQTARAPNESVASCIDCVRFVAGIVPGQRTLARGELGDCYGWVLWAVSRTHDPTARVNHANYALPPYDGAPNELNEAVLPFLVDWVRTAYSKGLTRSRVVPVHVLRNSLIPVITNSATNFGVLLVGATVTEGIFNVPGVGNELFKAINRHDSPEVVSIVTVLVIIYVLVNLGIDLLYGVLDPRIRYVKK